MANPSPRSNYRAKVATELATATDRSLSRVEQDAVVDYVWRRGDGTEARFDELLRLFAGSQRTWWGTPTLRTG